MECPLCHGAATVALPPEAVSPRSERGPSHGHRRGERRYHRCDDCGLLFVDPADHPDAESERERYRLHRNSRRDEGYVRFLSRLLAPVLRFVPPGGRGLDFGCGPLPVLAQLVDEAGWPCDAYDPLFREVPVSPPYDFILASEVLEHFRDPAAGIERVLSLARPEGIVGIMTEWWREESLAGWHYLSDPTHLAFYHQRTFDWIARRYRLELLYKDGERITVFRAPAARE